MSPTLVPRGGSATGAGSGVAVHRGPHWAVQRRPKLVGTVKSAPRGSRRGACGPRHCRHESGGLPRLRCRCRGRPAPRAGPCLAGGVPAGAAAHPGRLSRHHARAARPQLQPGCPHPHRRGGTAAPRAPLAAGADGRPDRALRSLGRHLGLHGPRLRRRAEPDVLDAVLGAGAVFRGTLGDQRRRAGRGCGPAIRDHRLRRGAGWRLGGQVRLQPFPCADRYAVPRAGQGLGHHLPLRPGARGRPVFARHPGRHHAGGGLHAAALAAKPPVIGNRALCASRPCRGPRPASSPPCWSSAC